MAELCYSLTELNRADLSYVSNYGFSEIHSSCSDLNILPAARFYINILERLACGFSGFDSSIEGPIDLTCLLEYEGDRYNFIVRRSDGMTTSRERVNIVCTYFCPAGLNDDIFYNIFINLCDMLNDRIPSSGIIDHGIRSFTATKYTTCRHNVLDIRSCSACLEADEKEGRVLDLLSGKDVVKGGSNLYMIRGGPFVKIGRGFTGERLRTMRTSNPFDLEVILDLAGYGHLESRMHELFKKYRSRGEWFRLPARYVREIAGGNLDVVIKELLS
jgi:hypothetical protein